MIEFSQSEVRAYYSAKVGKLKQQSKQLIGPCPLHQGDDDNFKVEAATGRWFCHSQCNRGGDIIALEQELTGHGFIDSKVAVFHTVGRPEIPFSERDFVAMYDYCDEAGKTLYQVVRKTPDENGKKRFMQRRPDGRGGWINDLKCVESVPFMLPKVLAATGILAVTEGEKDALTLDRLGIFATCNSGGAEHFQPHMAKWFSGKKVAVFFDNDEPGRKHGLWVAETLKPVAASVRIVELPDLPAKGDVTDFIAGGGTKLQIKEAYDRAVEWTPEWEFGRSVPSDQDKHVRTVAQSVADHGGLRNFWRMPEDEGIPTPYPMLTRAMAGGLRNQEVYVIGGDTGSGKTSLALQFAIHAMRRKKGVLLFSMEMGHRDVIQRMASMEARVDLLRFREYQRLQHPDLEAMEKLLFWHTAELEDLPLMVSDKGGVSCQYVQSETERLRYRGKIDLVILDHMQLMSSDDKTRGNTEKFTSISHNVKNTAKELNIPIIEVSQTNRGASKDGRWELQNSDLREAGAIEEDACSTLLIYPDKDDYQRNVLSDTHMTGPIKSWLKLGKNRYGWKDWTLPLLHFKTCTRFDVYDEPQS